MRWSYDTVVLAHRTDRNAERNGQMKMWATIFWGVFSVVVVGGIVTVWLIAMIHGGWYGR